MAIQISIPKGTRDFGTREMNQRKFIFGTIESIFRKYAYSPIETPSMENLSTLLGKYGEEGDRLIFKVLNSGNYLNKVDTDNISSENINKITSQISEKGLRYDLTVPFARFVVQHRNDITFPFKRYQIQPVWRADKPQKGRYREFYQCDVDVIGSKSLLNEFELIQICDEVFTSLGINVTIKINNRKILLGIAESIGRPDKFMEITVAIDKIDKIGIDKVAEELKNNGLSDNEIKQITPFLENKLDNKNSISFLKTLFTNTPTGQVGVAEIESIFKYVDNYQLNSKLELDLSLARGLNYYTGAIFEVKANDVEIGSICGGGRYDNLTEIFGLKDVSGVGISFGADRIYDVMNQLNLFPDSINKSSELLFVNFGEQEELVCIKLADQLRKQGISSQVYPDKTKLDKQFKYANANNISYVAIIGESELENSTLRIKNMKTGEQNEIKQEDIISFFK